MSPSSLAQAKIEEAAFTLPGEFEGAQCLIQNMKRGEITGSMTLKPYECFVLYHK